MPRPLMSSGLAQPRVVRDEFSEGSGGGATDSARRGSVITPEVG